MSTPGPSAESRLAQADRRRNFSYSDRQCALMSAVQMHVEFDHAVDQIEIIETAAVFLHFLETGEPNEIR